MRTDLERFFNPRAIAIVGASQDLNTISGQPVKFLKSHGYTGALYPVNPRYAEVAGVKCHARLADLPETPDLALILVNAARVPDVLRQCGEKGVPYVIIFSSGFAETGGTGAALRERAGRSFRHNRQSLRVVDVLERDGRGLNLTEAVRDGILNHTGSQQPLSLEGRVVRLVDRVAYINHDLDDALRAGIIELDDLPAAEIELLGSTGAKRIDTLARDIVEESRKVGDIAQSEEIGGAMLLLRKFMFERVYLGAEARSEHERVQRTLRGLFDLSWDFPSVEPPPYLQQLSPALYQLECQRVAARFDEAVRLAEQAFLEEL